MSLPPQDPLAPRFPDALVVMVRHPRAGQCKTRLCPPLSPELAAELYRAFLVDIGRELIDWDREIDLWVAWIDDGGDPDIPKAPKPIREAFPQPFRLLRQEGQSLAERMTGTFDVLHQSGYQRVVMRNSDSPHLPVRLLDEAFWAFGERRGTMVLGPDLGGGYVLVGLDVPPRALFPATMSTDRVLEETVAAARATGLHVAQLDPFPDINTPDDLATFWLEFGHRADVRDWATWRCIREHSIDRLLEDLP